MKFTLAFCLLVAFVVMGEGFKSMGPVGKIILRNIYNCKPPRETTGQVSFNVELKSIDNKGTKALYTYLENKIPIDNTITFNFDLRKWEGGDWKPLINQSGILCASLVKFAGKFWQQLRASAKPALVSPCPIPPNKYIIEKFQAQSKDLNIPAIFYGRLQAIITGYKDRKLLFCIIGESDSQAPF